MKPTDSRNESQKILQGDLFAAAQAGVAAQAMPDPAAELELLARRKKAPKRPKATEDDQAVSTAPADDAGDTALAAGGDDSAESSPFAAAAAGEPLRFAQADTGTRTDAGPDTPATEPKGGGAGGAAAAAGGGISTPALIGGVVLLGAAAAGGGGGGGGGGGSPAPAPADTTAPTIKSAAVTTTGAQNNTLNEGDTITGTVTFSEAVYVTGTPTVTLDIGGTLVQAAYVSGSGTDTLTFTYTIQAGQTDTDGISVPANALNLNGGTIRDAAGNNAVVTHDAATTSPAILVDTTAPSVTVTDDVEGTATGPVTFTFRFSEPVTGFDAGDITVENGTKGAFSGSGDTYTLVVTPPANASGNITVKVGNVAQDAAGNTNIAPEWAVQAFDTTVPDTTAPTVSTVAITGATGAQNNTLNAGDTVTATVTMSEAVTVTGTPRLALNIGGTTVQANYASGSGTDTLTFTYTIQTGQNDTDGISVPANALNLNGGSIRDAAGNAAALGHAAVADNASYLVDTTPPTVTVAAPDNTSDNTPTITGTATGVAAGTPVTITVTQGNTQTLNTTVQSDGSFSADVGTALSDGAYTATASVADPAGNVGTASDTGGINVDPPPTVTSVALTAKSEAIYPALNAGDTVTATVTMSETVTVTGTPQLALNIGGTRGYADYASGSGTNALTFTYTILNTQNDTNGISIDANSLSLNGGTIRDSAANDAILTHAAVADNPAYVVDNTAPELSATPGSASFVENFPVQQIVGTDPFFYTYWTLDPRVYDPGAIDNTWIYTYNVTGTDASLFKGTLPMIDGITGAVVYPGGIGVADLIGYNGDGEGSGTNNSYTITVQAVDAAGNVSTNTQAVTLTVTDDGRPDNLEVIDLGARGQLIMPFQVGVNNWYYFWDMTPDFNIIGNEDSTTHTVLNSIFTLDSSGASNPTPANGTTDTYRYADLNGVRVALPTADELSAIWSELGTDMPGYPAYEYWSATPGDTAGTYWVRNLGGTNGTGASYAAMGVGEDANYDFVILQYVPPVV